VKIQSICRLLDMHSSPALKEACELFIEVTGNILQLAHPYYLASGNSELTSPCMPSLSILRRPPDGQQPRRLESSLD
jgi:hypothetical protein